MCSGIVFNVQKFTIHDGPGIRTTFFLKGCNLNCPWCHNVESLSRLKELSWDAAKCRHCNRCVDACQQGALSFSESGALQFDEQRCERCFNCAQACRTQALEVIGTDYTANQLVDIALKDKAYFDASGGGVTISGGEPLLQSHFVATVFKLLKLQGVHTAIDTAGFVPWSSFERVLPYTDAILLDMKVLVEEQCTNMIGGKLRHFLKNLARLRQFSGDIYIRVPVVKGITDQAANIEAIKQAVSDHPAIRSIKLLPYHSVGADKGDKLLSSICHDKFEALGRQELETLLAEFQELDIPAMIG